MYTIVIEKDFWITIVLDYLFNKSVFKDCLVFKGGTCLSKCYNLTNRFSEDIDLVLDWSVLGYSTDEVMSLRSSKNREKFVQKIRLETLNYLNNIFVPTIKKDLSSLVGNQVEICISQEDKKSVLIKYENIFNDDFIPSYVKLEIGCLSAIKPSSLINITSYLFEFNKNIFHYGVTTVRSVSAESIFWEKVLILYQNNSKQKIGSRQSRHYYDLSCFYDTKFEISSLQQTELFKQAIQFTQTFYYTSILKNQNIDLGKINLIPSEDKIKILSNDVIKMQEMLINKRINFSDVLTKINKINIEINNLKVK